jgi:hypothetical protein
MELNFRYRIKKKIYQSGKTEYVVQSIFVPSKKLLFFAILLFIPLGWFIISGSCFWETDNVFDEFSEAEKYLLEKKSEDEEYRQRKIQKRRDKKLVSSQIIKG